MMDRRNDHDFTVSAREFHPLFSERRHFHENLINAEHRHLGDSKDVNSRTRADQCRKAGRNTAAFILRSEMQSAA